MVETPEALQLALAGVPIIVLIVLLVCKMKPLPAVAIAIVTLLALGLWFPIDGGELASMSSRLVGVTLNVVFILLGGLVLSVFSADSGAQRTMSGWLERATKNRDRAILLYGLGVTPFMDGAVGWGVSIIVVVPLLLKTGISATRAVIVALLGHIVGPWGSLGPGLLVTAELGQQTTRDIGTAAAYLNIPVVFVAAVAIALIGVGKRMTVALWIELVLAAALFSGTLIFVSWFITPALSGVIAPLVTMVLFLVSARLHGARPHMTLTEARSFGPFGLLLIAMLTMLLFKPLLPASVSTLLTSPGLWLVVAAASAPAFFAIPRRDVIVSLGRGLRSWVPVTIMTLLYISFGVLLSANGMSSTLAAGAASTGAAFFVMLPGISWVAGYLTASGTSVATMLTLGVSDASTALGADPVHGLGMQLTAGGAALAASPSRVALAVSVAKDAAGDEPIDLQFNKVALATVGITLSGVAILMLVQWLT